ncbi:MAG: protein-methionine-sulfoxide reductase heme-binding subunit MsrQ [Pseudomonadota bacterium]
MDIVQTINGVIRRIPPWPIYILLFIPLGLYTYWMLTGGLGADPVRVFEHEVGLLALQFLIAGLAITPLRELTKINLIKYRRAIGLMAFYYTFAHLSVYLVFDQSLDLAEIWRDIVKRPYITFGMAAFVLMVPLALTSNNPTIRKIGPVVWRKIHKLVYVIAIGAVLHFMLLTKTWEIEPMIYVVILVVLLGYRYTKSRKTSRVAA